MRNLDPSLAAALSNSVIIPAILVMLTFKSGTRYMWSGSGNLIYNGQTYLGVGALGTVESISEGIDVRADGTSIKLSGIDPTIQAECLTDIQLGAPAKIWFALLANGLNIIGIPYLLFNGTVDQPVVTVSPSEVSIQLRLENNLINLQRASNRRYTSADQRIEHPNDCAFGWVELMNDIALLWGT